MNCNMTKIYRHILILAILAYIPLSIASGNGNDEENRQLIDKTSSIGGGLGDNTDKDSEEEKDN